MGLFSRLTDVASALAGVLKAARKPSKDPRSPRAIWAPDGIVNTPQAGYGTRYWTDDRGRLIRAYRQWVYVAVNRVANAVAMQFPHVGKVTEKNPNPKKRFIDGPDGILREKALTSLGWADDIDPVSSVHPLCRLLADPNEPDTAYDVWFETILFLLLTGNAYWWVPKNKSTGIPDAIWVLPSHWVWPIPGKEVLVEAYELRPTDGPAFRQRYDADEIIHFRFKHPLSKVDGFAPMTAGAEWVDTSQNIDRARSNTYLNSAFPTVAVEFDPMYEDPSQDDLDRIEQKFMARYAGVGNAGKPMLLPPGVKVNKLSVSPSEMDFTASYEQVRDSVLALYGVPAVVAGITKEQTYGGNIAAHALFYTITVNPLFRLLGQTLTEKLARKFDEDMVVWWDDRTPNDPETVEKQISTDLTGMAVTPNEIRKLRGRTPYEHGGDDPVMPNVGLVTPWGSGEEDKFINPFLHGDPKKDEKDQGKDKKKDPPAGDKE